MVPPESFADAAGPSPTPYNSDRLYRKPRPICYRRDPLVLQVLHDKWIHVQGTGYMHTVSILVRWGSIHCQPAGNRDISIWAKIGAGADRLLIRCPGLYRAFLDSFPMGTECSGFPEIICPFCVYLAHSFEHRARIAECERNHLHRVQGTGTVLLMHSVHDNPTHIGQHHEQVTNQRSYESSPSVLDWK